MHDTALTKLLTELAGAAPQSFASLQELWSGYGYLLRCTFADKSHPKWPSCIVKKIDLSGALTEGQHPRGWNGQRSHDRKRRSYEVEWHWYEHFVGGKDKRLSLSDEYCRVPRFIHAARDNQNIYLVMEDLASSGFKEKRSALSDSERQSVVSWLAAFHASAMDVRPDGLWKQGTYWHLETRPDEWRAMADDNLKEAAPWLDKKLQSARYQTLIHGDAKQANFCFHPNGQVAAVDFQYVGGGVGVQDLAYFLSSCLDDHEAEFAAPALIDHYFKELHHHLKNSHNPQWRNDDIITSIEKEWRSLYPIAWADFCRFLQGWSPGHWKWNTYSQSQTTQALNQWKETSF